MLVKFRKLICTSAAIVFTLIAAGSLNACCPIWHYQPEPPK